MSARFLKMTWVLAVAVVLSATLAYGQGGGGRRGGYGGGGRGGPGGGSTNGGSNTPRGYGPGANSGNGARPATTVPAPAATSSFGAPSSRAGSIVSLEARFDQTVIDYVNGTLIREQDKNGDGYIDKAEWVNGNWSKSNPPENSDLNKDGKLSREELCIRISKSRGIPIKGESASSGGTASSNSPAGGGSSDAGDKFKKYAEGLLREHDKNKDGMLQRDEWKDMKAEHQGADSNSDGVITLGELTNRVSTYSGSGSGSSPSSGGSTGYGGKSFKRNGDKLAAATEIKKSYRFLTPTERLPKGMPDWFIKNDADGDGQIMMVEYSSNWTESTAAEFAKLDRDGDGIITPEECLAGEPKK